MFARIRRYFVHDLWAADLDELHGWRRARIAVLRVGTHTVRAFVIDLGNLQAAGLTLLTLLALVPMLALVFGIAKGLGYDQLLDQQLIAFASDLPPTLRDLVEQLRGLMQRTGFGALGAIGVVVLAYTALKLFTGVEAALNQIWRAKRGRSWWRRITDFVALVVLVPVLGLAAVSLTSVLQSGQWSGGMPEWFSRAYDFGIGLVPHLMMSIAFTALYKLMPATVVSWRAAAIAGVVAGPTWIFLYQFYLTSQIGVARLNAIYATFAALPLLLVYLQLTWTLVLVGAELCYAVQNLRSLRGTIYLPRPAPALQERLAVGIVERVCGEFTAGRRGVRMARLATALGVPRAWVDEVFDSLARADILGRIEDAFELVVPLRPPEKIRLGDVLSAVRGSIDPEVRARVSLAAPIEAYLHDRDAAADGSSAQATFAVAS